MTLPGLVIHAGLFPFRRSHAVYSLLDQISNIAELLELARPWPAVYQAYKRDPRFQDGMTELHRMAAAGNLAEVKRLLSRADVDVNAVTEVCTVSLHCGIVCWCEPSSVRAQFNWTPIHFAACFNRTDVVGVLLKDFRIDFAKTAGVRLPDAFTLCVRITDYQSTILPLGGRAREKARSIWRPWQRGEKTLGGAQGPQWGEGCQSQ